MTLSLYMINYHDRRSMLKTFPPGNSLVVQWLRLSIVTATGPGFMLDWGSKIPQDVQPKKKKSPPDHQIITDNQLTVVP